MGIVKRGKYFYWVKRVPKRYAQVVRGKDGRPLVQARQALFTDSETIAQAKAIQVEALKLAEWEALLAGSERDAERHYQKAKKLAEVRGYDYRPMHELTQDMDELVDRVMVLSQGTEKIQASKAEAEALMGAVSKAYPTHAQMFEEYLTLTKTRHLKKTPAQLKTWRQPRERAMANFRKVIGASKPIDQITRKDALQFRDWWQRRVAEEGLNAGAANKDIGALAEIWRTWMTLNDETLSNPFEKLKLEGVVQNQRPTFSRQWVQEKLIAPDAFKGLNDEARDVFLMLINTGMRPSEVTGAPLEDFHLDAQIPHLAITDAERQLKVSHTAREIPLLGVSLAAAHRIIERGGIHKYKDKTGGWSALVNKFLRNNDLAETPKHTAYSLRHYVEDALLAAGVDDRVRADTLGHKYQRPKYGEGGALKARAEALGRIAL